MVKMAYDEIETFVSGLSGNDFLLVSGNSYIGIRDIIRKTAVKTAKSGKKVAYFSAENEEEYIPLCDMLPKPGNLENISIFLPGSEKIDGIEVMNDHKISGIRNKLNKQLKKGISYDLLIIERVDQTMDFISDRRFMYSVCSYLKEQLKTYQVPIIATSYNVHNNLTSSDVNERQDRLYHDVRDVTDFLMFVEDNSYEDEDGDYNPSQVDIRLLDCRIRELNLSFLYNIEQNKLYKKEGKALELFKKAEALGLDDKEAAEFATYWREDISDSEEEEQGSSLSLLCDDTDYISRY